MSQREDMLKEACVPGICFLFIGASMAWASKHWLIATAFIAAAVALIQVLVKLFQNQGGPRAA